MVNPFTFLRRLLLHPVIQELRVMSDAIQSKIDAETLVADNNTLLTTLSADLKAALAAAAAGGATAAQLAAFDAMTARI
jgi:hypothetical protein